MMRSVKFFFFLLLLLDLSVVFAQNETIQQRLQALQLQDNLGEWLYQRMDYVTEHPDKRFPFLMETQQKSWRQPKTKDEKYAWLSLLNTQGYYQLLNGAIIPSISSYEAAFAYYLKHQLADYEIVEYTLKPLSNNYTRLGDYESALYLQQRSLNLFIRKKEPPANIAAIYSNMAISFRSMGNFTAAEKSIYAGLSLAPKHFSVNIILNNTLADLWVDQQRYAEALHLMQKNLQQLSKIDSENAYWAMSAYTTIGNIYLALHQYQQADQFFGSALQVLHTFFPQNRLREKANILTQRGKIKLLNHQPLIALKYFDQTLTTLKLIDKNHQLIIQNIYGDNKLVEVFEQISAAYQQLNNFDKTYEYLKLALLSAGKIRKEFAEDETKERLQVDLKSLIERAITCCYEQYHVTKSGELLNEILTLAERSKSQTLLDQLMRNQQSLMINKKDPLFSKKTALERLIIYNEKQQLENKNFKSNVSNATLKYDLSLVDKQIKQKYKQFNVEDINVSVKQLIANIPNTRILEYFVGDKAIFIVDIDDRKVTKVIKIDQAKQLKSAITSYSQTYFQHGPSKMLNAPKEFYMASHALYKMILTNIKFKKNEKIIIIPDETLGYLSFDGLITNEHYQPQIANWPYLLKQNTITYAFSLKTLLKVSMDKKAANFTGLFITHENNNNVPLKAVQEEASAIKKIVKGKFLYNNEVNLPSFNEAFENSTILHMGTHAYLSGKKLEPTLALNHEKIFLFELAAKKEVPSLVVLSACRTADGLLANGEGIISLSRGFTAMGTPATVAGLWNVNDAAASQLTASFYTYIKENYTAGEALHKAKIDWLNTQKKTNDAYCLPYYWDSLIYMGTDQKIELSAPINWQLIFILLVGALLFGGIFLMIKKSMIFQK